MIACRRGRAAYLLGIFSTALTMGAAEFSQTLSTEDFSAAGLNKLTPEELNRLNELVEMQRTPATSQTRDDRAQRSATTPKSQTSGITDQLPEPSTVEVTPGTSIRYKTIETELAGDFRGYQPGSVLTLANGQRWQVLGGSYWSSSSDAKKRRKVRIEPGMLGSFFLRIEDGGRPKVKLVGTSP